MIGKPPTQRSGTTTALGIGAVAAMALCCLAPALLIGGGLAVLGGGLAAIGGFLSSPLTVVTGLVLAGAGLLALLRWRRARRMAGPRGAAVDTEPARCADRLESDSPTGGKPRWPHRPGP